MSVTPKGLARTLLSAAKRRQTLTAEDTIHDVVSGKTVSFFVHDNDGGILRVEVTQYKDPLR